jgi:3-oxoacyl-[acyl-carrier protein] reductase
MRSQGVSVAEWRDVAGTVVAITGASSGIGAATARELVAAGARVVLTARREDRLRALCSELGGDSIAVVGDIREPATSVTLVQTALDRFGQLDSLVANAGLGVYGSILEYPDSVLVEMVEANFLGTVWAVRSAVREFRGGGDVVVVASVAGLRGGPNEAVYAATKFAQVGLAGAIDRELRTEGIRVTAICPAGVKTEFALGAGRVAADPALDRMLRAEDVAAAIVTVLRQPRRLRTSLWTMYSMAEGS